MHEHCLLLARLSNADAAGVADTLDYNQEAQYYHVYSSNHEELASAYFPPITAWSTRTIVAEDLDCVAQMISDECSCGQDGLGQEVRAGARAEGRDQLPGQCDALQLPLGAVGVPEPRPVRVHALVSRAPLCKRPSRQLLQPTCLLRQQTGLKHAIVSGLSLAPQGSECF